MRQTNSILIKAELDAHLKEYEALRGEIREYIQRLDKYIGIYIASIFAVVAVFLNPNIKIDFSVYFRNLLTDEFLIGFTLIVPILNSILQLHLISFMYAILSIAKYVTYSTGGRIKNIVKNPVFYWDHSEKNEFLFARLVASSLYSVGVASISISILVLQAQVLLFKRGVILGLLYFLACCCLALSFTIQVQYLCYANNFSKSNNKSNHNLFGLWVFFLAILLGIMYICAKF